jgi:hypothetical protein
MNHKVKGVGMSTFNDQDVEKLNKFGNEIAYAEIMAEHNSKLYPEPEKKDIAKLKEFFKLKY